MNTRKNLKEIGTTTRLGRPRDNSRNEVIIAIALKQLTKYGYANLSTTKIAEEAKVSKATLYRRWPSKKNLVIDAFKTLEELTIPQEGSLEKDLRNILNQLIFIFTRTNVIPVLQILTGEIVNDEELSEELFEWIRERYYPIRVIFENAIKRGELSKDTNIDIAETLVVGPLLAMVYYSNKKVDRKTLQSLVDLSLKGYLGMSWPKKYGGQEKPEIY